MKEEPTKRTLANGRIDVDYGFDADGKNHRTSYPDEDAAAKAIKKYKAELKQKGEFWVSMRPLERDIVVTTLREIKAENQKVQDVWADWKRWRKDNASS